jgi:hypothetical protein
MGLAFSNSLGSLSILLKLSLELSATVPSMSIAMVNFFPNGKKFMPDPSN